MIITIARKCGCDGDVIGRAVAEKYNMTFLDKEVISQKAKEYGCYDEYEEFYGETPVNSLLYSIVMETDEDSVLYKTPEKALSFIKKLDEENKNGGCVIQGRCGNYAFKDNDDMISIFLTADEADCIENVKKKHGVSERKAKAIVRETNVRRKTYHKYYTGQDWGHADNYDLCLNVSRLGVDGVLEMIASFIQNKK